MPAMAGVRNANGRLYRWDGRDLARRKDSQGAARGGPLRRARAGSVSAEMMLYSPPLDIGPRGFHRRTPESWSCSAIRPIHAPPMLGHRFQMATKLDNGLANTRPPGACVVKTSQSSLNSSTLGRRQDFFGQSTDFFRATADAPAGRRINMRHLVHRVSTTRAAQIFIRAMKLSWASMVVGGETATRLRARLACHRALLVHQDQYLAA